MTTLTFKADFHIHSLSSWDGLSSVTDIISYAKQKKFSLIAITDHNAQANDVPFFSRTKDIIVIRGTEFYTNKCDLIVFGDYDLSVLLRKSKDIFRLLDYCREENLITYFPHPYRLKNLLNLTSREIDEIISLVSFVEYYNGRSTLSNIISVIKKPKNSLSGSDAHHVAEIGNAYTVFSSSPEEITTFDVLSEVLFNSERQHFFMPSLYSWCHSRYLKLKERKKKTSQTSGLQEP